jgi:hypothetical protein
MGLKLRLVAPVRDVRAVLEPATSPTETTPKDRYRFNSVSLMLGGRPHNHKVGTDGKETMSKKDLAAILDFVEETKRFTSRNADRDETSQSTPTSTATRSTRPDEPSSQ